MPMRALGLDGLKVGFGKVNVETFELYVMFSRDLKLGCKLALRLEWASKLELWCWKTVEPIGKIGKPNRQETKG